MTIGCRSVGRVALLAWIKVLRICIACNRLRQLLPAVWLFIDSMSGMHVQTRGKVSTWQRILLAGMSKIDPFLWRQCRQAFLPPQAEPRQFSWAELLLLQHLDSIDALREPLPMSPALPLPKSERAKSSIEACRIAGMLMPKVSAGPSSRGDCGEPVFRDDRHDVTDEGLLRFRSDDDVDGEIKPLLLLVAGTASEAGRTVSAESGVVCCVAGVSEDTEEEDTERLCGC